MQYAFNTKRYKVKLIHRGIALISEFYIAIVITILLLQKKKWMKTWQRTPLLEVISFTIFSYTIDAMEQYSSHMFMETRYTFLQLPLKPVNLEYQQIVHSDDKQHINYHCSIVTKNIQVALHRRHKHSSQGCTLPSFFFSKLKCKTRKLFHRKFEGMCMLRYNWCHLCPAFHIIFPIILC